MPAKPIDTDTAAFLKNVPLFSALDPAEIDAIAQATVRVHARRGQALFRRGDPCSGFHVVVYGQVKLAVTTASGSEKVIEIIGPGQSFGEAVMFLDRPYMVNAECLADTLLLTVAKDAIVQEIERNPQFSKRVLAELSMRLHRLVSDVEAYSLRSGTQRVIGYLLRELGDGPQQGPAQVALPAAKGVIASRLNLTQEHFSRLLHSLQEAGLIQVSGREVKIPDLGRLRGFDG